MKVGSLALTRLSIVPLMLVMIGLGLLVWTLPNVLHGQAAAQSAPGVVDASKLQDHLNQLTKASEALKERLDSISHDAATAQWLLAMVLGVAGLLTLAQGVFAFFSAQSYVKQADDAIKRANEAVGKADTVVKEATEKADKAIAKIDALAADVRTKYPMFADIEAARTEAFNQLSSLTPALDADQNLYAQSDPLMRQAIFAIESFSAIQFLTPTSRSAELLRNLRLLGKFYAGKFVAERESRSDFERSQYYFELALQKFGRPFSVLNDMGWLFATIADPLDNDRARSYLEESLRRRPNQQRALFDLATMIYERGDRDKLAAARQLLLQAARQFNWEDAPNPGMASHVSYNLACVYDALAELEAVPLEAQQLLDQCMECFESASKVGYQTRTIVEGDVNGGDLCALSGSAKHADRLQAVLAIYEMAWQRL